MKALGLAPRRLFVFRNAALVWFTFASTSAQTSRPTPNYLIIPPGYSLKSDGGDPYRHREQGVVVSANLGLVICTDSRTCTTRPEAEPAEPARRALHLDLSSPIAASGAANHGIVRATAVNFGAFWEQDKSRRSPYKGVNKTVDNWVIRTVFEIEVGRTVESQRVEIRFFLDGVQHVLQFGPWTAGEYQATNQSVYHGEGTTRGTITRVAETKWFVRSGEKSIGRLWNNRDPAHPVDRGLYQFTYEGHFERQ